MLVSFVHYIPNSLTPSGLLLLLIKRYNLYKVLACSTTFFHLTLLCATFFQYLMFMLFISSQRVLGLTIGLLDMGFNLSSAQYYPQPCVQHGYCFRSLSFSLPLFRSFSLHDLIIFLCSHFLTLFHYFSVSHLSSCKLWSFFLAPSYPVFFIFFPIASLLQHSISNRNCFSSPTITQFPAAMYYVAPGSLGSLQFCASVH